MKVGSQVQENESTRARDPTHVKRRTSAGSGSGRCGAGHLHLHRAAKELQRRKHQEPRCQPVAFAPILASFRLTTQREQNEAEGESKATGSKAHARNGTEVAVLPRRHRASHEGLQGRGAVIWCVHRDASCHLRCRLSGTYQSDSICMAFRQERHSPSGSAQTTNECLAQAPRRLALPRLASLR